MPGTTPDPWDFYGRLTAEDAARPAQAAAARYARRVNAAASEAEDHLEMLRRLPDTAPTGLHAQAWSRNPRSEAIPTDEALALSAADASAECGAAAAPSTCPACGRPGFVHRPGFICPGCGTEVIS